MNWILLVIAGLFEVAFAFSLGKAKESTGNEMYLWYLVFAISMLV
ncbi:MAG: QacE family quaternary ammonium compound efflux SMR transporter, partial [Flavobacterium sp.]